MSEMFRFNGQELAYFRHPYNRAAENMRTVEIPIVRTALRGMEWAHILEIGNVLAHYGPVAWPAVDLRERGDTVINADVMAWQPPAPLDLIVSISTLEHIDHDKYVGTTGPTTPADALARIRSWLAPGGRAVITAPLRYNERLDRQIATGEMPADEIRYMVRQANGTWVECGMDEALAAQRPEGYRWAVAMAVLYCHQEGHLDTLNLGAGKKPIEGAVNHDLRMDPARPWVTVAHDLNVLPWPWADSSFDRIVARAVLEHLDIDLVASLNECWRILRPGGQVYLKLPAWDSELAHSDCTHRWFFSMRSFDQFDPDRRRGREYDFYTDRHWRIVKGPRLNDAKSSIHLTMEVCK